MDTTDDRREDPAIETAQLRPLLFTIGAILIFFGLLAAIAGWGFSDWRYQSLTFVIIGTLASLVAARVLIHRARSHAAELREAHLRLSDEREWMDLLAAGIMDGVLATDGDGYVKVLNATAERLTGWTRQDARDRDLAEVFHIDPPILFPSDLHEASRDLDGPVSANEPLSLVSRDGVRRLVTMTAAPLRRNGTEYVGSVLVFRDVTDRVRDETLEPAPLPAVMECLAGRAADEFRNLLTTISGRADLLDTFELAAEARGHVQAIRETSTRGTFLARQLLGLRRRAPEPARTIDVAAALREVQPMLEALCAPDVTLTIEASSDVGSIVAAPQAIDYTLLVLAAGARELMTRGGEVLIEASHLDESHEVRVTLWMTAYWDEDRPLSTFEAPFTYMNKGAPRPMPGLSAVAALVAGAGGSLSADTHSPTCKVFNLHFPRVSPPAEPQLTHAGTASTATVLLLEDSTSVRVMLSQTLRHHGYTVLEAAEPGEALRMAQTHQGPIQVALVDLELPNEPGDRVAARLNHLRPELRIIFMSTARRLEQARAEWTGEIAGALEKPFLPATLINLLRSLLEEPGENERPHGR